MDTFYTIEFHHQEHNQWLSKLNFYQDEIKIFQNELMVVLHKHAGNLSIIEHIDEYRAIFLKKLGHIDDIRKQIFLLEKSLKEEMAVSPDEAWDHQEVRKEVDEFVNDFEAMKKRFKRFVSNNFSSLT